MRKVTCLNSIQGCACHSEGKVTVYHAEAAQVTGPAVKGELPIKVGDRTCLYPESLLVKMNYAPVPAPSPTARNHSPLPMEHFLASGSIIPESPKKQDLGLFWPTFYHLALEELYPGQMTPILDPQGRVLGHASDEFLRQVTWEGSGITLGGQGLLYAGPGRYLQYQANNVWGYGAGGTYQILPYRTIAVNFAGFCAKLASIIPGCTPKDVLGLLLYSPDLAAKKIKMQDGTYHDGYLCATDTGSPYYIRADRIDIFVGTHGGGNPFLPAERQANDFIAGGIRPLLPSDWRWWTGVNDRIWCSPETIPKDIFNTQPGECAYDYHVVARDKGLRLFALFDGKGKLLRCNASPAQNRASK